MYMPLPEAGRGVQDTCQQVVRCSPRSIDLLMAVYRVGQLTMVLQLWYMHRYALCTVHVCVTVVLQVVKVGSPYRSTFDSKVDVKPG
jgi:hypothetical protein